MIERKPIRCEAEWCECIARGIFRGVHLRAHPAVFVEDVWVETSVGATTATVRATLVNASPRPRSLRAEARFATCGPEWAYPSLRPMEIALRPGAVNRGVEFRGQARNPP